MRTTDNSFKCWHLIHILGRALILFALSINAYAAITDLASEPLTQSKAFRAAPNILFVLDDSGSMEFTYSPDWADPANPDYANPDYRFSNGDFNGIAYNPATRYYPPVMYTPGGAIDATSYPSQTGDTAATGADSTAKPNWKAVKKDGYGIQAAPTVTNNLVGNAYSYTTIAGEYCDSAQLRNCIETNTATGSYTFPAKLRWCTTEGMSKDSTANVNGFCQATYVDNSDNNIDKGLTPYFYPRTPRPRTSTITINATGNITDITVGGFKILSVTAIGGTTTALAADIVTKINACTFSFSGACTSVGFTATSINDVVTLTAPNAITLNPIVTGGSTTVTAFSGGSVPGAILRTVISKDVAAYKYPGAATKGANRSDCEDDTFCTYKEEMTNYANWWAYYHTRMQMMKTATSIAFAPVGSDFRVGYSSINNGGGNAFLNLSEFDATQKFAWYTKFLSARAVGTTPLRTALTNAGRLYAGKLTTFNDVTVIDPVQYSCQQNYTILSTDGYWNDPDPNDPVLPKKVDGTTPIGQQDGTEDRPYYDGATQTRTVTQTLWSEQQLGINTFLVESRTRQQQTTTAQLEQSVTTTDTYPFTKQTTTLQTRTTPLNQTENKLESRSYPLIASTQQLQKNTFQIASTARILQSYTSQLTQVTTPLQQKVFNITKVTTPLQDKQFNITKVTTPLQRKQFNITKVSTPLEQKVFNITKVSTPLQKKQFYITSSTSSLETRTYNLKVSTYNLRSSTRKLQKRSQVSTNGGDSYTDTGWVDATSCTVTGSSPVGTSPNFTRNTTCQYGTPVVAGNQSTCSTVAPSPSSPYTVPTAVTCAYETTPVVTAGQSSCAVVAQSGSNPYSPSVSCAYETTPVITTGTACTVVAQSGSSPYSASVSCGYGTPSVSNTQTACSPVAASTGPSSFTATTARTCTHNATVASTTDVTSCTASTPNPATTQKSTCTYSGTPVTLTNETSCTAQAQNGTDGPAVTCTHNGTAASSAVVTTGSCTAATPANAATPKTTCTYTGTPVTLNNETSCGVVTAPAGPTYSVYNTVSCTHNGTAVSTTDVTSCAASTPSPATAPKYTCTYTGTPVTLTNETSCTVQAQTGTVGPAVTCTHNGTAASTTNVTTGSCTTVTPANAAAPKHTCGYTGTPVTLTNETSCGVVTAPAGPTYSVYNTVSCTHNAAAASTANVTSCNAATPSPAATPKTTCTYTGTPVTVTNLATCTAVPPSTANTYTGPAVACTYQGPVTATNLTTCTAGAASAGPVFNSYQTCGYINGTVTPNLNACAVIADSTGPNYTGPARSCAYQGTSTPTAVTTCNTVAPSGTFAAPSVTCNYLAAVNTTQTTCTVAAPSAGPAYTGPAVSCAYDTTASTTNLNASACTANRQTASPYSGPAVNCSYNATATPTNNVTSCTTQAQSTGPAFVGPSRTCTYGTPTAYVNATAACTPVAQSGGSAKVGPARDCTYTTPSVDTLVGTCTPVSQNNTNLVAVGCLAGAFPDVGDPVTTTVDTCSTAPTSSGSPIVTSTATTCTYLPAVTEDTATCTPAGAAGSPVSTSLVTCSVTNPGLVYNAVAPTCTPAGVPPSTFDASGKIVECRTTNQIGSPISPVPVASCSPLGLSIDSSTKVQQQCTLLIDVPPTPISQAACFATVGAPVGPSFIKTTCDTTSANSSVTACTNQTAAAPLWQTVSCAVDDAGTSNTLADTAEYYFKTDLRTPTFGNCTSGSSGNTLCATFAPPATDDPLNNVPTSGADNNKAQHMTTFTLGLGASGFMQYKADYVSASTGDFATVKGVAPYAAANGINANPSAGTCSWQTGGLCNWPYPDAGEQTTIDDLWHAGVNGRGAYFSATDPTSLSNSISGALASVAAAGGAAATPALGNVNLTEFDNYIFSSTFTSSDWDGELIRQQLDPVNAALLPNIDWAAQAKLDARTPASRKIYTYDAGTLKAFTAANFATDANFLRPHISTSPPGLTQFLCASATVCLSTTKKAEAEGANLVDYLRGVRTNEGAPTDNDKYYRQRKHVLGDIVNSSAVFVSKPRLKYSDAGYSDFITAQALRRPVVYVGANDGMLHAFAATGSAAAETAVLAASRDPLNAAKAATAAAAMASDVASGMDGGQELWAYIPSMVLPNLYKLADKDYAGKHRYYVDATPVVSDICASACTTSGAVWKTILVGGLGHGGRGYYALDITDPANPKALWEFTNANLGYSYGNPRITKLKDGMNDGKWVVLVTSGYNNIPNEDGTGGDGKGHLYTIDAATGNLLGTIDTNSGSTGAPSGLSQIALNVVNPTSDNTAQSAYAGDLAGGLWRFDINSNIGLSGYDAQLLASLQDGDGNPQPIATKPEIGVIEGLPVIYVGTGKFLALSDATDTSTQSVYAIKDNLAGQSGAIYSNPGGSPRDIGTSDQGFVRQILSSIQCPQNSADLGLCTVNSDVLTATNNAVSFTANNGWFVDLIGTGEKANTNPSLSLGNLALNTNTPTSESCNVSGGTSRVYQFNYLTGGPIYAPGNGDYALNNGVVGGEVIPSQSTGGTWVIGSDGIPHWVYGRSDGTIVSATGIIPPGASVTRRTSWRELIRE